MGTTERTWIYLENNRLVPVRSTRPSGHGPWRSPRPNTDLVVAIEGLHGSFRTPLVGPKYSDSHMAEAIKLHLGITPENFDPKVWRSVPSELKNKFAETVRLASEKVGRQWEQASNEEFLTGALFAAIDGVSSSSGWTVQCKYIEFSKQAKEPATGADLAIVLDVVNAQGKRAFKSIWLQAKKAKEVPTNIRTLPRLAPQIDAMRKHTDAAYAVIYTPKGAKAVNTNGVASPVGLDALLNQAMACRAGDPNAELLGKSMNRQYLLEVLIQQARAVR